MESLISMAALTIIEASQIIVTSFSSASPLTGFCAAIKDKQIRETRRNPVPKQRCISVPHSGSGRGLSCSRLWNRIQKVCGTVWEAQSSFWWHLLKSHSSQPAITFLCDENHCSHFFSNLCVSHLSAQQSHQGSNQTFLLLYNARQKEALNSEGGSLMLL